MQRREILNRYRHLRAISVRHYSGALDCLARPAILEQPKHLGLTYGQVLSADSEEEMTLIFDLAKRGRSRASERYAKAAGLPPGSDDAHPKRLKVAAVDDVAWELGVSRATLYRLIERYRATRTVEGLRRQGRGRPGGTQVLDEAKEILIREIIEREYLKPTRPPFRGVLVSLRSSSRRDAASSA